MEQLQNYNPRRCDGYKNKDFFPLFQIFGVIKVLRVNCVSVGTFVRADVRSDQRKCPTGGHFDTHLFAMQDLWMLHSMLRCYNTFIDRVSRHTETLFTPLCQFRGRFNSYCTMTSMHNLLALNLALASVHDIVYEQMQDELYSSKSAL